MAERGKCAIAAPLQDMLAELRDDSKVTNKTALAAALTTYAQLAAQVSSAWSSHWTPNLVAAPMTGALEGDTALPAENYDFSMKLAAHTVNGQPQYQTLTLTTSRAAVTKGFGSPTISVTTADGTTHPLTKTNGNGGTSTVYNFPGNIPAFTQLDFNFSFAGLHVASYQNAATQVRMRRNAQLLGPTGAQTSPAFVYQTPQMGYSKAVEPFINIATRLPIGKWSYTPVQGPLAAMFNTIFNGDSNNRTIACGMRYGYELVAGNPGLETYLPVKRSPTLIYGDSTITDITNTRLRAS